MVLGRHLRHGRAAQFKVRPSAAQGLAGRVTPPVTLVILSPAGRIGRWAGRIRYPRLEVLLAVPESVSVPAVPPGARVVRGGSGSAGSLVAAALEVARGEIVVVLPPGMAVGPGFVQRFVAPFVDPFVAATVARVVAGRPDTGLAARMEDVDLMVRAALQVGRNTIGAPVLCDREPFAVRRELVDELGGWEAGHPTPDTDLMVRAYVRGFLVSFVEDAVALAPAATWRRLGEDMRARVAGRRSLWRAMRRPLYRRKVLEGPEKTDLRWATRGAAAPFWLASGWTAALALRAADTSWVPEAVAVLLVVFTFATVVGLTPFLVVTSAAVVSRRRRVLLLVPWLPLWALAAAWSGTGAALTAPLRYRRPRGRTTGPTPEIAAEEDVEAAERGAEEPATPRPPGPPRPAPRRRRRLRRFGRKPTATIPPQDGDQQ